MAVGNNRASLGASFAISYSWYLWRPIGFSSHARAKANAKPTFTPDHSVGADHDLVSHVYVYAFATECILELVGLNGFLETPAREELWPSGFRARFVIKQDAELLHLIEQFPKATLRNL